MDNTKEQLIQACLEGHLDIVKDLIASNVENINTADDDGHTPTSAPFSIRSLPISR
jgi:ankyrin repeat protein